MLSLLFIPLEKQETGNVVVIKFNMNNMKKYVSLLVAFLVVISSCTVEHSMPGDPRYVDSIAITNKIKEIIIGEQHKFVPAYYPWDAEGFELFTWQSSDNTKATIDQNGLLTAIGEGEATIRLSSQVKTKKGTAVKTNEVTISIIPVHIQSIQLNRGELEMPHLSTYTLTVSFVPSNAKPKEIDWTSSNETVASVNNGVVTAKSIGYTYITAKVRGTDITTSCYVTVNPVVVTGMQFDTDTVKLEAGFSASTTLVFVPANAENKNVTYVSSRPSVASVNNFGVITGVSNGTDGGTGAGPGKATITATSVVTGVRATCTVEVYAVPDLLTVSVYTEALVTTSLGSSGYIKPTLHNNSSKPVHIVRFRLLDRNNNYDVNVPIGTVLEANSSYTVDELIRFVEVHTPRVAFDFTFEGKEYRSVLYIAP